MSSTRTILPVIEAQRPLYVGLDLGGTNIKAALVDNGGRLVAFHTEPTQAERGPEDAAARMGEAVGVLAHQAGITAALAASHGAVAATRSGHSGNGQTSTPTYPRPP